MIIYTCKHTHPRLTVGDNYQEWANYPHTFNAAVINDIGEIEFFPRDLFFETMDNENE